MTGCTRCGGYVFRLRGPIKRTKAGEELCYGCHELATEPGKADHDSWLRCPKCKSTWPVADCDDGALYGDGVHWVCCPECDQDSEIVTQVSHSFTSP